MKFQWTLIFALVFAILVAIFAIANIDAVPINYVFGTAEVPLVLVILSSTLLGGLIVGLVGIIRQYRLQRQIRNLEKQLAERPQASLEQERIDPDSSGTSSESSETEHPTESSDSREDAKKEGGVS